MRSRITPLHEKKGGVWCVISQNQIIIPTTFIDAINSECYCQVILYPFSHSLTHGAEPFLRSRQLCSHFPAFYATRMFIIVFTRALHWSLSWARWIQSIPSHPISLHWIFKWGWIACNSFSQDSVTVHMAHVSTTPLRNVFRNNNFKGHLATMVTWSHTPWLLSSGINARCSGLVVKVPGYISRGPGFDSRATRFSEKYWVWNRVHSASWV
jgi:hypothetical protein